MHVYVTPDDSRITRLLGKPYFFGALTEGFQEHARIRISHIQRQWNKGCQWTSRMASQNSMAGFRYSNHLGRNSIESIMS
jgi:hypothetical protein